MRTITKVELLTSRNEGKQWTPAKLLGSITGDNLKKSDDILHYYTSEFINRAERKVRQTPKLQYRMMLRIFHEGGGGWTRIPLIKAEVFLVARLVYNPDKVYKQLDGEYRGYDGGRPIRVVGKDILNRQFQVTKVLTYAN